MNTRIRMPALFIGHGSPMNTLQRNTYTDAWRKLGKTLPRPRGILMISAHWLTRGTQVTAVAQPETIHDFTGFPKELFEFEYPAPGMPDLARRVADLLNPMSVRLDQQWGLDHGTWSVLAHVYPEADVPVVQLSMDGAQPSQFHYDLGKRLSVLRDEGIMIMASGNVVHNLRRINMASPGAGFDWAERFNTSVRSHLEHGDHPTLIQFDRLGDDARLSIPTSEHYLPLLYIIGAQRADEKTRVLIDGLTMGSISMLAFGVGV